MLEHCLYYTIRYTSCWCVKRLPVQYSQELASRAANMTCLKDHCAAIAMTSDQFLCGRIIVAVEDVKGRLSRAYNHLPWFSEPGSQCSYRQQ